MKDSWDAVSCKFADVVKLTQDTLHATKITLYPHTVIEMADGTHSWLSLCFIQMMQNGNFYVERAYKHISSVGNYRHDLLINWYKRWKLKIPLRLLLFGLKLAKHLLLSLSHISYRSCWWVVYMLMGEFYSLS